MSPKRVSRPPLSIGIIDILTFFFLNQPSILRKFPFHSPYKYTQPD